MAQTYRVPLEIRMCGFFSQPWLLAVGGMLQLGGLILLMRALTETRKRFDTTYSGPMRSAVRRWKTMTGRIAQVLAAFRRRFTPPRRVGGATATVEVGASAHGVGTVSADLDVRWNVDEPTPVDVRALLIETRDQLRNEIQRTRDRADEGIADEAGARDMGDREIRDQLNNLALGSLQGEWRAAALILIGISVSTLASLCIAP